MSGFSDRGVSARREGARARLAALAEEVRALEATLESEPGVPEGTARVLVDGAKALCPVATRAGIELTVSAGPAHQWVVDVDGDPVSPRFRLRRVTGATTESSERTPSMGVAVELAEALRNGRPR